MVALVDGTAADATELETTLLALVRRSIEAPAFLGPADLAPLRRLAGDSALTYTLVLGAFHYINRIADLLHVDSEFLPEPLLRFAALRRVGVFFGSKLLGRMDLRNRSYTDSFETACAKMAPAFARATGRTLADDLEPLRARPWLVEVLRHSLEERGERSLLTREETRRVYALVEQALPRSIEEAEGFHPRPKGALEDFVFVGTRYAARTTPKMIAALAADGYDELRILDLAHLVSDANQWARVHRLLGLRRDILAAAEPTSPITESSGAPGPGRGPDQGM